MTPPSLPDSINRYLAPLVFFIIPFLGGNHLSFYYVNIDKFWIETIFIALLVISILTGSLSRHRLPGGFLSFTTFFMPWVFITTLSLFYTWSLFDSLNEINALVWVWGTVFLYASSGDREILLKAVIMGSASLVACMFLQYAFLYPNLLKIYQTGSNAMILTERVVPTASFVNEATLGGYFLFGLFLAFYYGFYRRSLLYISLFVVILSGLIMSLSRIGMILAFLFALAGIVVMVRERGIKGVLSFISMSFVAVVIFFAFMIFFKGGPDYNIHTRFITKLETVAEHITTLTGRTDIWRDSLAAFLERPFVGYGSGAFEYAFRKFYSTGLYTRYAHSSITKVLVELGMAGLSVFLFYIWGVARRIGRSERSGKNAFIVISLSAGFVFSLFNISFESPAYLITFFAISSFFFLDRGDGPERLEDEGQTARRGIVIVSSLLAVLLLTGSFLYTSRTNLSYKLVETGAALEEQRLYRDACIAYQEATQAMPFNHEAHIRMAAILMGAYNNAGSAEERMDVKGRLVHVLGEMEGSRDRNSGLFLALAMGYSLLKDMKKADAYFKRAVELNPFSAHYLYRAARYYFETGDEEALRVTMARLHSLRDRHRGSLMHGIYTYRVRDLESEIAYRGGDIERAFNIAAQNLREAEEERGSVESLLDRAGESREAFFESLRRRVIFLEKRLGKAKRNR